MGTCWVVFVVGNVALFILLDLVLEVGARSYDDVSHFQGGVCHSRCVRTMIRGLEIRVLDGTNTHSLIRPGHESSGGSTQLIRRWGLIMGSIPGATHW